MLASHVLSSASPGCSVVQRTCNSWFTWLERKQKENDFITVLGQLLWEGGITHLVFTNHSQMTFQQKSQTNIKIRKECVKTEAVAHHLENDDLFLIAPEVKFSPFWSTTRLRVEENSLSINRKLKLPLLQAISCQGIHTVFSFPSWK